VRIFEGKAESLSILLSSYLVFIDSPFSFGSKGLVCKQKKVRQSEGETGVPLRNVNLRKGLTKPSQPMPNIRLSLYVSSPSLSLSLRLLTSARDDVAYVLDDPNDLHDSPRPAP